jgi:chromosome segregation protein
MELSSKQKDISNIDLINQKLSTEIDNHNKNIQTNIEIINEIANKVIETQKGYEDDTAKLKSIQNSLKEQNETIYLLQQEVARLEAKNSKIEADVEAVISKLWDEYELTYNTALEYKKADFDMNQSQKEAASLRGQIKQLGNINIDAIEEYKEVKEKFDFLTTQKNDLDETKEKLEDIIREMQTVMTEKFVENFNIIQDRFNSVFHELFGGGSGRLTLTDPDNVLESGIEIEVQPPGKKLQNMMALSGGEKALSAIALLFSVLEVRPTPFCILDEVEAALDDNNVYRFADYIRKYSEKTQFIVVTHRRGTMEAADIMYGITMQEKGVSKLLKLKFEDLEDYN